MSPVDYRSQKMRREEVKKLINKILAGAGSYKFSGHSLKELKNDGLSTQDALNVLMTPSSVVLDGEFENGSWRYQVRTGNITVVVAFDTAKLMAVVSAWRVGK